MRGIADNEALAVTSPQTLVDIAAPGVPSKWKRIVHVLSLALALAGCEGNTAQPVSDPAGDESESVSAEARDPEASAAPEVAPAIVLASEVDYQPLNPARGDASPMAGTLWGDRGGVQATGFLLKPTDGFESPPHIHNISYRGVVIRGVIHNDDPKADELWMPAGSFWTQPRGHVHITAARGADTLAYVEIDSGPYLVRGPGEAFASEERPINVDVSNIVWADATSVGWDADAEHQAEVAFLWGTPQGDERRGLLVRIAAGATATLSGSDSRVVVVQGNLSTQRDELPVILEPGSFLGTNGGAVELTCAGDEACITYVHANGQISFRPNSE